MSEWPELDISKEAHDARHGQTLGHPSGADIRDGLRHSTDD
jgi:hypothetical protein